MSQNQTFADFMVENLLTLKLARVLKNKLIATFKTRFLNSIEVFL
jgi:hypothetical protein